MVDASSPVSPVMHWWVSSWLFTSTYRRREWWSEKGADLRPKMQRSKTKITKTHVKQWRLFEKTLGLVFQVMLSQHRLDPCETVSSPNMPVGKTASRCRTVVFRYLGFNLVGFAYIAQSLSRANLEFGFQRLNLRCAELKLEDNDVDKRQDRTRGTEKLSLTHHDATNILDRLKVRLKWNGKLLKYAFVHRVHFAFLLSVILTPRLAGLDALFFINTNSWLRLTLSSRVIGHFANSMRL